MKDEDMFLHPSKMPKGAKMNVLIFCVLIDYSYGTIGRCAHAVKRLKLIPTKQKTGRKIDSTRIC